MGPALVGFGRVVMMWRVTDSVSGFGVFFQHRAQAPFRRAEHEVRPVCQTIANIARITYDLDGTIRDKVAGGTR